MISIDEIREGLDTLPNMISGGPGTGGPTEYLRRQDVLSMLDKMKEVALLDMACVKSPLIPTSCFACRSQVPDLFKRCKVGAAMGQMNRDRIPRKHRVFYALIGLLMAGIFIYARPISGPMVPFGVYLISMIITIGVIITVC